MTLIFEDCALRIADFGLARGRSNSEADRSGWILMIFDGCCKTISKSICELDTGRAD